MRQAISKFAAETEKAQLEAQQIRVAVAEKSSDMQMNLDPQPWVGHGDGWYTVLVKIRRNNSGTKTMVIHSVRFSCGWAPLDDFWVESWEGETGARARWLSTLSTPRPSASAEPTSDQPTSPGGLKFQRIGPDVQFPLGGDFTGLHRSNFDSAGNHLAEGLNQPNGVGIYMAGETMEATHLLALRFARTSLLSCDAEIEYSVDDRTREVIARDGLQEGAPRYLVPFTNTAFVCGELEYAKCKTGSAK